MRNRHPLDPLSFAEIQSACDIVKKDQELDQSYRFGWVLNHEPSQDVLRQYKAGRQLDREAFICVFHIPTNDTFNAIVNLSKEVVVAWAKVTEQHAHAPMLLDDANRAERIVKQDTRWRAALKARSLTDEQIGKMQIDPSFIGHFGVEQEQTKNLRIVRVVGYLRDNLSDNGYARPIDGLFADVDLTNEKVWNVFDDHLNTPIPPKMNYASDDYPNKRSDIKPLHITQPDGPSFSVNGWNIAWQNWQFQIGFNAREGLTLHHLTYQNRPIIARASISEIFVPYGGPKNFWNCAFDAGEYGLGKFANELKLGCDCLGHIHYFDAAVADDFGYAFTKKNAICLHEEDAHILWKHSDVRNGLDESRRGRELVISFTTTIYNYGYGFYWRFNQAGNIKLDVTLNGLVQTGAIPPGTEFQWGGKLTQGLVAPTHQHFFNARFEMQVDGDPNYVTENEFKEAPLSADNSYGNSVQAIKTLLAKEQDAVRRTNGDTKRTWNINSTALNGVQQATAYKLHIPHEPVLLAHSTSHLAKCAGFATQHLWVTAYDPSQRYAAGDFPNQNAEQTGLPQFINENRSIDKKPLVVWATFGSTHLPSSEEAPIMPTKTVSIELSPFGFFNSNPTMDIPRPNKDKSVQHASCCVSSAKVLTTKMSF